MKTSWIVIIIANLIAWSLMVPISRYINKKVANKTAAISLEILTVVILLFLLFILADCLGYPI